MLALPGHLILKLASALDSHKLLLVVADDGQGDAVLLMARQVVPELLGVVPAALMESFGVDYEHKNIMLLGILFFDRIESTALILGDSVQINRDPAALTLLFG